MIEVLTEQALPEYLAYLKSLAFPMFCRGGPIGLYPAAEKSFTACSELKTDGGRRGNELVLLAQGCIDELSLVIAPVADGSTTAVSIFEQSEFSPYSSPIPLCLEANETSGRECVVAAVSKRITC